MKSGFSRARAIGAIGALGLSAVPIGYAAAAPSSKEDPADLKLLNSLLAIANAGVALYNEAITAKILSAPAGVTIGQFAGDHAAHRDALVALITSGGGQAASPADTPTPAPPSTEIDLLTVALAFERQATGEYVGAIGDFKNRALAKTAASILGVDAAHVALLAEALRQVPAFPTNFVTT